MESGFVPCTPLGCQRLLSGTGIEISGAHVVILGRSMNRRKASGASPYAKRAGRRRPLLR
jgi:hypothetical protein